MIADADGIHLDSLGHYMLVLPSFLLSVRFCTSPWELSLKSLKGHSASRWPMTERRGYYYPSFLSSLLSCMLYCSPGPHGDAPVSHSGSWLDNVFFVCFSASRNFQRNHLHFNICLSISFWRNLNEDKLIMSINF